MHPVYYQACDYYCNSNRSIFLVLILDVVHTGWLLLAAITFAFYALLLGFRAMLRRYIKTRLLLKYGEVFPGVAGHISSGGRRGPTFLHYVYAVGTYKNIQSKGVISGLRRIPEPRASIEVLVLPGHSTISMPVLACYFPWFVWVEKFFGNVVLPIAVVLLLLLSAAIPVSVIIFWDKL